MDIDVISEGWDGTLYRVRTPGFEVVFMYLLGDGPDPDLDKVANVDAVVQLPDGSRWSVTIFTVTEVERLMNEWTNAGEALDGGYFWCSDGLIVREPGIRNMTALLAGLHQEGNLIHMLKRLDKPS